MIPIFKSRSLGPTSLTEYTIYASVINRASDLDRYQWRRWMEQQNGERWLMEWDARSKSISK